MKKLIYTSLFALLVCFTARGQKVLTLEECINIALDNNLNIKRARNTAVGARSGFTQSKLNFLPFVSASSGANWNEGNALNTAFERVSVNNWNASSSVNASINIFNGLATINTLAQSKLQYEASLDNIENTMLNTKVSIVGAYLAVIQGRENLNISEQALSILEEQLSREEKREAAGVGNMESVYNFRSRVANQRLDVVSNQNRLKSSELTLIQLLLLDPSEDYEFPPLTVSDALLTSSLPEYKEVYEKTINFSPSLRASESQLKASQKGVQIAKSNRLPSLGASAGYSTGWTSSSDETFLDQYDLNQRKSLGFNLSIPIFNNGRTSNQIQQAKVRMMGSELDLEIAKNTLTNLVQQAYLDLVNAHSQYQAANENMEALNKSFEFSKNRYESGTTDFVTYLQNLNEKNQGEFRLANAKYAFLLRDLVLKLYMGEQQLGN